MATKQSTIEYLKDQIAEAGEISFRKMFGEYAMYCNGKVVGLVCDDQLFVKQTEEGKKFIAHLPGGLEERPPYPGAKLWIWISGEDWENREQLCELIRITEEMLPVKIVHSS